MLLPLKPILITDPLSILSPTHAGMNRRADTEVCPYRAILYVRRDPILIGAHGAPYEAEISSTHAEINPNVVVVGAQALRPYVSQHTGGGMNRFGPRE